MSRTTPTPTRKHAKAIAAFRSKPMKPSLRLLAALLLAATATGCAGMIKERITKSSLAIWNDGKLELLDERYSPEAAAIEKAEYARLKSEYDSWTLKVDHVALDGDYVASVWTFNGVHKTTGKPSTATGTSFALIEGGKVVRVWRNWDTLNEKLQAGYTLVEPGRR